MAIHSGASRGTWWQSTIAAAVDIAAWLEGKELELGSEISGSASSGAGRSRFTASLTA